MHVLADVFPDGCHHKTCLGNQLTGMSFTEVC